MDASPAPPIAPPAPRPAMAGQRLIALLWFVPCVAMIGLAAWLSPRSEGVGTHQQLGMQPCSFLSLTGYPCATCGMTTAFAYAAHGQLGRAFVTQPAGALVAVLTAAMAIVSGYALAAGLPMGPVARLIFAPRPMVVLAGVALASWVYKIILIRGSL